MATTRAVSGTFARFSLLELQVRSLLRDAGGASEQSLDSITRGLKEPHYIEKVRVYGLDSATERIRAELLLSIDWRRYAIAVEAGGERLRIPASWKNNIAPSLSEAVRTFNMAVEEANLLQEWVVQYGSQFNSAQVNKELGFVPAEERVWAQKPQSVPLNMGPLEEASLVISLAI